MPSPVPLLAAWLLAAACASCAAPGGPASPQGAHEPHGWAVHDRALTLYGGRYVDSSLPEEILLFKPLEERDSHLLAAALSHVFARPAETNQWEVEGQVAKHTGEQDHWEFNLLALWRWKAFPWNEHLRTTLAIGDGLSLVSEVPAIEEESHPDTGSRRLLNYLLIEATFAPPSAKNWAFVFRIHHRSGIMGLFGGVDGGSNVLTGGLKFLF